MAGSRWRKGSRRVLAFPPAAAAAVEVDDVE